MTKSPKEVTSIRLDKWLWAARFYKTRAIAKEMINGGKVHYNGQRAKSSKVAELSYSHDNGSHNRIHVFFANSGPSALQWVSALFFFVPPG